MTLPSTPAIVSMPLANSSRELLGDAAHVTIASINRHLKTDKEQNITGLSFQPESNGIDDTLSCAISSLLFSLHALSTALERKDYEQVVIVLNAKWKALYFPIN
jgi:hypothetical protein